MFLEENFNQSREMMGSLEEWPAILEAKAKEKLPPDLWEGISNHTQAFREYWANLVGKDDDFSISDLTSVERSLVSKSKFNRERNLDQVDPSEKDVFFGFENNESRNEFLARKKLEMQNRMVESIGNQGEKIAEKSAEVLKSAWSGMIGSFRESHLSCGNSNLSFLFPWDKS